jgi:hypothetical protein
MHTANRSRGWLFLGAAFSLSCGGTPFPRETTASNTRADDPWLEGPRCTADFRAETALKIETVEPGTGKVVGDGETVRVHYIAQLPGGSAIHDTREGGAPIELVIGSTKIICGFERALLGMHAGERRRVTVPWRLAFGEEGRAPDVGPRTDLVFVIDLFLPAEPSDEHGNGPVRPPASRGGGGGVRGPGGH